ncbi:hypothetical protein DFA_07593 [Cavenderia fasciculata]|uniref:Uncharacterized protein n=1 Tax=Cavenderia fasciculata TaxID=261658 RepID=F4Q629_CACFS|nr:uncharacterized protein DFA_07593 [Cavenderia fasciculata]EGG16615.1 hypothetical protein DFA_07593 [Cavenderia fasciculata]|eukprot:XP_004355089.1 hypothetical protein DFA_07593 [Cavenderia fasciculata]
MGIFFSTETKSPQDEKSTSVAVQPKQTEVKDYKILLLGAGDSGKSTIARQTRYIYLNGYTDDEAKDSFHDSCQHNILLCIQLLCRNLEKYGLKPAEDIQKDVDYYKNINPYELPLENSLVPVITAIWKDPAVQQLYSIHRNEIQLPDVAKYCLENVDRIASDSYVPSKQDILNCLQRTTSTKESEFIVDSAKLNLFDFGGKRKERRQWFQHFEGTKAVVFCAALSDYNITLIEDQAINRLEDTIQLWKEVLVNPAFKHVPIFLLLTKQDIFREKLGRDPLEKYFSDYTGGDDFQKGVEHIRNLFFRETPKGLLVVAHVCTATSTENIKTVFDSIRKSIVNINNQRAARLSTGSTSSSSTSAAPASPVTNATTNTPIAQPQQ